MTLNKNLPKILITGASSGLGEALVSLLASQFYVIAVARRIERMRERFNNIECNVELHQVDLADPIQRGVFIRDLVKRHSSIPFLINNAGVMTQGDLDELEIDDVRRAIEINALAPWEIMKFLIPSMREQNYGRIINITSGAPLNCFPGFGAYSSSKAMLNSMTVTIAREMEKFNIKINLMSPGPIRTQMAPNASLDPSICFPTLLHLLNLQSDGPSGKFFWLGRILPIFPDLSDVDWLNGEAGEAFPIIL